MRGVESDLLVAKPVGRTIQLAHIEDRLLIWPGEPVTSRRSPRVKVFEVIPISTNSSRLSSSSRQTDAREPARDSTSRNGCGLTKRNSRTITFNVSFRATSYSDERVMRLQRRNHGDDDSPEEEFHVQLHPDTTIR